jgi:hypothetical protein
MLTVLVEVARLEVKYTSARFWGQLFLREVSAIRAFGTGISSALARFRFELFHSSKNPLLPLDQSPISSDTIPC